MRDCANYCWSNCENFDIEIVLFQATRRDPRQRGLVRACVLARDAV